MLWEMLCRATSWTFCCTLSCRSLGVPFARSEQVAESKGGHALLDLTLSRSAAEVEALTVNRFTERCVREDIAVNKKKASASVTLPMSLIQDPQSTCHVPEHDASHNMRFHIRRAPSVLPSAHTSHPLVHPFIQSTARPSPYASHSSVRFLYHPFPILQSFAHH